MVEKIAIVTGGNKGVGLAIGKFRPNSEGVRQLALQYPNSPSASGPLLIYLTARDKGRGETAVRELEGDSQLKKAKALVSQGGQTTIKFAPLDISKTNSIRNFSDFVRKVHPEGIDYVINNAGIAMSGFDLDIVETTLRTNYYGTLEATQTFLPLIRKHGRLINVASMSGHLSKYSDTIRNRFLTAKTSKNITALMEDFKAAVANGNEKQQGFISAAYAVSKAGIIGMTKTTAIEAKEIGSSVLINSCCPGYVKTDMTGGGGPKTPDQGAQTPVMLALADIGGKSGGFWQHEKEIQW